MTVRPAVRADHDLTHAAWHIARELRILSELYRRYLKVWPGRQGPPRDEPDNDASVVACLAHLRCLAEFLVGRPKDRDAPLASTRKWRPDLDMCPEHFVVGWENVVASSCRAQALMAVIPLCDQRMSHLSWERLAPGGDFYTPTIEACVKLFTEFVGYLRVRRSKWVDTLLPDAIDANARCGWPLRLPTLLWFHLPDHDGIQRNLDLNGNALLRQLIGLLTDRLPFAPAADLRAASSQEDRFFCPAVGALLLSLDRGSVAPRERALVSQVLAAIRRAGVDASVPESVLLRRPSDATNLTAPLPLSSP